MSSFGRSVSGWIVGGDTIEELNLIVGWASVRAWDVNSLLIGPRCDEGDKKETEALWSSRRRTT